MPILPAETSIFPDNLLEDFTAGTSERSWLVVHSKARQEKALARHLLALEIPFYLPLIAKNYLIRERRVQSYIPLFSGYVFLYGTERERFESLTTNRISHVLPVSDEEQLCCDLRAVQQLIETDAPLTVESRLQPGQPVRVIAGAMAGLEGTVVSRRGKTRLIVSVNFLQQGVSFEVDDFLLEPAAENPGLQPGRGASSWSFEPSRTMRKRPEPSPREAGHDEQPVIL